MKTTTKTSSSPRKRRQVLPDHLHRPRCPRQPRVVAGEQPQMYGVATVDYELQCRVKNSTGVAPKWYSPSTSAPPTHPTMKLALRSAARTATLSGLTTYCDPLAFRVRMIHRSQDSDEASGAKRKSSLRKSAWSDTSDWMQTSPNKPARPTSLQQDDEFTSSTSIGVYWSAPQDNGAAI